LVFPISQFDGVPFGHSLVHEYLLVNALGIPFHILQGEYPERILFAVTDIALGIQ
jgi:hypothetical protein